MVFGGVTSRLRISRDNWRRSPSRLHEFYTFKLLSASPFFGAVFCFSAFCFKKEILFLVFFAISELLIFATQAPVNYVCLHSLKPSLRPLAMAMATVSIHVFGDVPSLPLVGVVHFNIDWARSSTTRRMVLDQTILV
ncbi:hypothetical protein RND81_14G195800 [Saponaria officinalis]|uniref:Uncharacterized protein n=1 Tax=Saponaria officinalis TaxID=3572 RepID=A0AAW1GP38_SAPOF